MHVNVVLIPKRVAVLLIVSLLFSGIAGASTLSIGYIENSGEKILQVPVTLSNDGTQAPSSLAFTVDFGNAPLEIFNVVLSDALLAKNKTVDFETYVSGVHVLVGGVNTNTLPEGPLVKIGVSLTPRQYFTSVYPLNGSEGSAAELNAERVPLVMKAGSLTLSKVFVPVIGVGTLLGIVLLAFVGLLKKCKRSLA